MSIRSRLIGAAVIAVAAFAAAWIVQGWRYDSKISQMQTDAAQQLADATQLARMAEQARWTKREEIIHDAKKETAAALADADRARVAADRLRTELASLQRRARDTAVAGGGQGQSGADTLDLLIGLLSGLDAAGRDVSRYADGLRVAGLACERGYESLQ